MQQPINIFIIQFRLKTFRQTPFAKLLPKSQIKTMQKYYKLAINVLHITDIIS